jgi:hypothetical protein
MISFISGTSCRNGHIFVEIAFCRFCKGVICRISVVLVGYVATLSLSQTTALCWTSPLFYFLNLFTQTVGLLGRGISSSQGRYLHTGQHKRRINEQTDIHSLSGIRIHDPSVRASEDSSCLRRRGQCDLRRRLYSIEL